MRLRELIPEYEYGEVLRQNEERKLWREGDTDEFIERYFFQEYAELLEAIEHDLNIAYLVASEIGDILFLGIKYEVLVGEGNLKPEMRVCINHALEICALTGLDPVDCLVMKTIRNELKYFAPLVNNGFGKKEATALCKRSFKFMMGEEHFSQWYLEFGETLKH